jgi:hypothetical protein
MEYWGRTSYITPICALILKSTPSVLIILIRVIRIVNCKVCKSSSVREMKISYDVLFWMVGQECMKKKSNNQENEKKMKKKKKKKKKKNIRTTIPFPFMFC